MKRYSTRTIAILIVLSLSIFSVFAETGVVEFKYFFKRVVADTISDMYFTDINKNRISSYDLDLSSDLSHPQVFAAVYTNKTTKNPYTITLSFTPLTLKYDPSSSFWGEYQAKVYRLVNEEYTDITDGTVTVSSNPSNTYSTTFTGDYSPSNDISVTCYYPISFYFEPYLDSYADGSYKGTVLIEAAAT